MDLSTYTHTGGAPITASNPAYDMIGGGGGAQGGYDYEFIGVYPGIDSVKAVDVTYEMPSPPSHQPLPTIPLSVAPPTDGDMGVAREAEDEVVYDNIPGDQ